MTVTPATGWPAVSTTLPVSMAGDELKEGT